MGKRKMEVLALAALVLASTAAASGGGETYFTDTVTVNPFGSCSLAWNQYGDKSWSFNGPPCGYPDVTCFPETQGMDNACTKPMPNANLYSPSEIVIATYDTDSYGDEDGSSKSSPCPVNFTTHGELSGEETTSMDCPVTCFDCASMCRWQAASVATKESFYDPTIPKDACNAWVFCTNPDGCEHGGKKVPGLSCTLKRIPLDNPNIQRVMSIGTYDDYWDSSEELLGPPESLIDKKSSGKGSDFVSGLCNVRATCKNNATLAESCTLECEGECDGNACGNDKQFSCGGYPMTCSDGCLPSCPC